MKLVETKVVNLREIHETAIVHPSAKIGRNVVIGPYAVIGENVEIGDNCVIGPQVMIDGWTTIGSGNKFYHGASIGCEPQDLKFKGEKSFLVIGDDNMFRENVTISRGTEGGGGEPGQAGQDGELLLRHEGRVGGVEAGRPVFHRIDPIKWQAPAGREADLGQGLGRKAFHRVAEDGRGESVHGRCLAVWPARRQAP